MRSSPSIRFERRSSSSFVSWTPLSIPAHKKQSPYKYPKRFLDTRLTNDEFARLADEVQSLGMVTMCTPFDETSVDVIENMGLDVIKIASCSATDWPLLGRVAEANKSVVFSTGGLKLEGDQRSRQLLRASAGAFRDHALRVDLPDTP